MLAPVKLVKLYLPGRSYFFSTPCIERIVTMIAAKTYVWLS
jgi:hypothetical protein